jgi:hypothetical protein
VPHSGNLKYAVQTGAQEMSRERAYIIKKESDKMKKVETIPISEKLTMTKEEAAAYSNIGINRLDALLRAPNCPFVLFVGTKKLIKRKEFEEFISKTLII